MIVKQNFEATFLQNLVLSTYNGYDQTSSILEKTVKATQIIFLTTITLGTTYLYKLYLQDLQPFIHQTYHIFSQQNTHMQLAFKIVKIIALTLVTCGVSLAYSLYLDRFGTSSSWTKITYNTNFKLNSDGRFLSTEKTKYYDFGILPSALEKKSSTIALQAAQMAISNPRIASYLHEITLKDPETLLELASSTSTNAAYQVGCLKLKHYKDARLTSSLDQAKVHFTRALGNKNLFTKVHSFIFGERRNAHAALEIVDIERNKASFAFRKGVLWAGLAASVAFTCYERYLHGFTFEFMKEKSINNLVFKIIFNAAYIAITTSVSKQFINQITCLKLFDNPFKILHITSIEGRQTLLRTITNLALPAFLFYQFLNKPEVNNAGISEVFGEFQQKLLFNIWIATTFSNDLFAPLINGRGSWGQSALTLFSSAIGGLLPSYLENEKDVSKGFSSAFAFYSLANLAKSVITSRRTSILKKILSLSIPIFIGYKGYRYNQQAKSEFNKLVYANTPIFNFFNSKPESKAFEVLSKTDHGPFFKMGLLDLLASSKILAMAYTYYLKGDTAGANIMTAQALPVAIQLAGYIKDLGFREIKNIFN